MRKALAFLLGCLLLAVGLEVGLRLASRAFLVGQDVDARAKITWADDEIRILALGESTTAVAGNDAGSLLMMGTSYPAQLEAMLNQRGDGHRYAVVNRGTMGGNSRRIVHDLDDHLANYRPDIVLVMMGMKDEAAPADQGPAGPDRAADGATLGTSRLVSLLWDLARNKRGVEPRELVTRLGQTPSIYQKQIERDVYLLFRRTGVEGLAAKDWDRLRAQAELGVYYQVTGRIEAAEALARQLVAEHDAGHNLLATTLVHAGRPGEAARIIEDAVARHPSRSGYFYYLAEVRRGLGEDAAAEAALRRAVAVDPDDFRARNGLGDLLLAQGRSSEGIALLAPLVSAFDMRAWYTHPDNARFGHPLVALHLAYDCMVTLARLFHRAGRVQEAESLLLGVLDRRFLPTAVAALTDIYEARGDSAAIEALTERAAREYARIGEYYELARLYVRDGRRADLPRLFEVASAAVPATREGYAEVYERCTSAGARVVFLQYPTFPVEILEAFLPAAARSDPRVRVVDNEAIFAGVPATDTFIEARYPYAFGHYTREGARRLAANVEKVVVTLVGGHT